ncbi:MAG: OB-fold nucleic acid binding domain-containing protein [Deltaproteobacteria bacterium]|jgi:hypothetical protein
MLKRLSLMMGMALLSLLLAFQGFSQPQVFAATPGSAGARKARHFNPQAVETLAGKVVAVNRKASRRPGRPDRISLVLQTDQGNVKVFLGPADYLDQQALKPAPGDQVEVKGTRITRRQGTFFIAGQVKRGNQILQLRDNTTGRPLWTKGKKRNLS